MSSYDEQAKKQETEQQQVKGLDSFLSQQEREDVQRKLGFPEEFPSRFWSAVLDKIALEGLSIPASQIQGATFYRPKIITGSFSSANQTSYTDVGAPSVTLGPGTYLLQYGWGRPSNSSANLGRLRMAPSVNGSTPSDADAVDSVASFSNASADSVLASAAFKNFFKTAELTENNNTVKLLVKVTNGLISADRVWLIAIKIGN